MGPSWREGAAQADPWTKELWGYDLRTNKHFTLKNHRIADGDLKDFLDCYWPGEEQHRVETDRFRKFGYEELVVRNGANLDITWLRDDSFEDLENLPDPQELLSGMIEDLQGLVEQLQEISEGLS